MSKHCSGRICNIKHCNTYDNNSKRRGGARKSTTQIPLKYRANILDKECTLDKIMKIKIDKATKILQPYISRLTKSIVRKSIVRANNLMLGVPDDNVKLLESFVRKFNEDGHFAEVKFMDKVEYKGYFLNQAKAKHGQNKQKSTTHVELMKFKKQKQSLRNKRINNISGQPLLTKKLKEIQEKMSELQSKLMPEFSEQDRL